MYDRIIRGRNAIFGHVARLPDNIPAHQAMLRQVKLSVGRPPDPSWKRPPGRPRTKWTDQLRRDNNNVPIATLWRQSYWSRSLESDATVRADYALTTTTSDKTKKPPRKTSLISSSVLTKRRLVTVMDGQSQTDMQTDGNRTIALCHSIYIANMASSREKQEAQLSPRDRAMRRVS